MENMIVEAEYKEVTALEERDTMTLTVEANLLYQSAEVYAQRSMTELAEVGKRLNIIKQREGHGNWMEWCENNLNFSYRKAKNCMNLAEKIEENTYLQTFANIEISKIWAILGAPEDVQKEVAENPEIMDGTVRELKEKLKRMQEEREEEKQESEMEIRALKTNIRELDELVKDDAELISVLEKRIEENSDVKVLEADLAKMSETAARNHEALVKESKKLEKAIKEKHRIEEALEQAKADLQKQPDTVIDEEAVAKAVKEEREKAEKNIEKLQEEIEQKERELREQKEKTEAAAKKNEQIADSTMIIFAEKFKTFQKSLNDIKTFISEDEDQERRNKMSGAIKKAMTQMAEEM